MDAGQIPSSTQVMDGEAETIEKYKNSMKGEILLFHRDSSLRVNSQYQLLYNMT